MFERLLRLLGRATIDLDAPARALADQIFDEFDTVIEALDPITTRQLLRTRYMRAVAKWGLPPEACNEVAERAWRMIAKAQEIDPDVTVPSFSFYE